LSRTLLIDADLIAYRCTAALQDTIDWNGDGSCVSINGRPDEAKAKARQEIERAMDELNGHDMIVCLSDEVVNFRKQLIDPTYKENRSGTARPVHLYDIKEFLETEFESCLMPRLEADDVLGILATEPHKGDRIMVSLDKDQRTIPALLCRPPKEGKWMVESITPEAAQRFHLWQTLCGDIVDGYPGCPGVGPVAADEVRAGPIRPRHTFKSGPRKGLEETRWTKQPGMAPWEAIVSTYAKAGQTAADALKQARLAFILRHGSLDGNRIKLWEPEVDLP
jgi:DNA polymerase I